ncbi:MAG TPA: hypothetical protein VNZ94_05035 [Xanthobacteraceae bacterium]|nr:hypothetical protein [Xanthobacteraceae bacterium]
MKRFDTALSSVALRGAGFACALLLMTVSPGYAQSGPFIHFGGAWTGSGTVSLSDGSKERIRCRAQYNVAQAGNALTQSLRCASDSYRFDLSSDVVATGGTVTGRWSEASRGLNGELQGRVRDGRIDVFVQAAGFAGNLSVTTRGNRQSVTIDSKGDLRGVTITMTRGG